MAIKIGDYPGVFPTITDLSQVTQATSTSVVAAVGEARKGSIFKRRLVTSSSQLATLFGEPDLKYGYMEHCLTCALEDAGETYVVRSVADNSVFGAVKVPAEGHDAIKFEHGYSLKQEENKENDSFFYEFDVDEDGNRTIKYDESGQEVVDYNTLFAIVAENPNEEDIRVSLEETTVLPSNKRAMGVSASPVSNTETEYKYLVTVKTGDGENELKEGDKVIITNCPSSDYNGRFEVIAAKSGSVKNFEVTNSFGGRFYIDSDQPDSATKVNFLNSEGQPELVGYAKNSKGMRRFQVQEVINMYYSEGFRQRTAFYEPLSLDETADNILADGYWHVVIKKSTSENLDSELYYVFSDSADHTLQNGNKVYKSPKVVEQYEDLYSSENYDLVSPEIGVRFIKEGTKLSSLVTGGIEILAQEGQFYYTGNDLTFLGKGEYVYANQDLDSPIRDIIGLTDEEGKSFDGVLFLETDENNLVVYNRFVKSSQRLYTDKTLLKLGAISGIGDYTYTGLSEETPSYGFSYELSLDKSITTLTPQSGLRWVKVPENRDRKFDISVYDASNGTLDLLETFNDCTLYGGKDGYGSQTKITSKINGVSEYIQIVMNEAVLNSDDNLFPRMLSTSEGKLKGGYCSGAISTADLIKGWDLFADTEQVSVNLLLHCGYTMMGGEDGTVMENKLVSLATSRRDCFAILDIPQNLTKSENAVDYRKNILGVDSYRAALYTPWVQVYDSFSGVENVLLPPCGFIAQIMARTDYTSGIWTAPAGLNRGIISCPMLNPIGLTQYYDNDTQGVIYKNGINYIRKTSGVYVVWGQKTLQFKASAMDRINVARLVFYIETTLKNAAKWHLFENNTSYRRAQITMQFESFLDGIKAAGGLYAYKVVCDETNNDDETRANNQMNIDIYIQPEYAAEFIRLQTVVQKAGATVGIS